MRNIKQTIRYYVWEIAHGQKACPFTMAISCKKKLQAACIVDGKCCPWTINTFPESWIKCTRIKMFLEEVNRPCNEYGSNPNLKVK